MTEKKFNFTDERLRKTASEEGKRTLIYDSKQPGLALMITANGSRSFKFRAWDSKRKKSGTVNLGSYPKVSIIEARKLAGGLAGELAAGTDVWTQFRDAREEPTLDQAFNRWVFKKAAKGRTSWKIDKLRYDKHVKPRFGNKKAGDIKSKHLEDWFNSLPEKAGISATSANRILVIIKTVFNQELKSYLNPTTGISLNSEDSRERFLRPAELPNFFKSLEEEHTPGYLRDLVYLALYTGARKANLLGMKWQDIDRDLKIWTIPAKESKNRKALSVALIPEVIEILNRRWVANQSSRNPSVYVFPQISNFGNSGHMTDIRDSWAVLLRHAGIADFRFHDLRRTMGSWQTITGASSTIVGKTLGHKTPEATAVYARMNLDPVRASMEKAVEAMKATRDLPKKVVMIGNSDPD